MIELYVKSFNGVWFGVACENQRVFSTSFASDEQKVLQNIMSCMPLSRRFQVVSEGSPFALSVLTSVKRIYDGEDVAESVPLAMEHLPAYTQRILKAVSLIPVGYVSSYGLVAEAAGGGARAVGNVMANNPFAPLVPCHRVVTAALTLGGYGGGLDVKHAFLVREKRGYSEPREIPIENGNRLQVFPLEFVLKKLQFLCRRFNARKRL
jgi:O-6-methylguanine DNA methyltransferase